MSGIPASGRPVAALMDAEPSVVDIVPLFVVAGGSHPLLLHALVMDVPFEPAPLVVAPAVDVVVLVALASDSFAMVVFEDAARWRPKRRLLSKTLFELQ